MKVVVMEEAGGMEVEGAANLARVAGVKLPEVEWRQRLGWRRWGFERI